MQRHPGSKSQRGFEEMQHHHRAFGTEILDADAHRTIDAIQRESRRKGIPEGVRTQYAADAAVGLIAIRELRGAAAAAPNHPFGLNYHKLSGPDKVKEAADYYATRTRLHGQLRDKTHNTAITPRASNASPILIHPSELARLGYVANPTTHIMPASQDSNALRPRKQPYGQAGVRYA